MAFVELRCRTSLAWLGWYVVPFIVILSAIVFVHELGHYLVGRWCGVKIDAFSLGFGPELFARVDSRGTRWRIGALPLGGYVKFHGDANAASVESAASPNPSVDPRPDAGRAAVAQPRGDRAGRAGRQFHPGVRDLHRNVHGLRPGRARGPHRRVELNSPAAAAGFQAGRPGQIHRRRGDQQFRSAAGSHADEHRPADALRRRTRRRAMST